jgi:hypothetical protein
MTKVKRDEFGQPKGEWTPFQLDLISLLDDVCSPGVDPEKSNAAYMADILDLMRDHGMAASGTLPLLGLATTRELLEEIKVRMEMERYVTYGDPHAGRVVNQITTFQSTLKEETLNYRTVDGK